MENNYYSIVGTNKEFIIDSELELKDTEFAKFYDINQFVKMQTEKPKNDIKNKEYISTKNGTWLLKDIVPQTLSRSQALTIMDLIPYNENKTIFQLIDDYMQNEIDVSVPMYKYIKNVWQFAIEFKRDDFAITTIAAIFNISDETLDEMFIKGNKFSTELVEDNNAKTV